MPQPFAPKSDTNFVLDYPTREKFSPLVGEVAIRWSHLEQALSGGFVSLFAGREELAHTIYNDTIDRERKNQIFLLVTKNLLSDEQQNEWKALFAQIRKAAKKRNKIIHGTWASIEGDKDNLYLLDFADLNSLIAAELSGDDLKRDQLVKDSKFERWSENDFCAAISRIKDLYNQVADLNNKLRSLSHEELREPSPQ